MISLNIQTTNQKVVDAIKSIILLDSTTTYSESQSSISQNDAKILKELVKKSDNNELEFYSLDEMKEKSSKYLEELNKWILSLVKILRLSLGLFWNLLQKIVLKMQ